MGFVKREYSPRQTTITSENLNAIQDELIRVGNVAENISERFVIRFMPFSHLPRTLYMPGIKSTHTILSYWYPSKAAQNILELGAIIRDGSITLTGDVTGPVLLEITIG